ncbi:cupin domain-containing protein [Lysobacter fragariae]
MNRSMLLLAALLPTLTLAADPAAPMANHVMVKAATLQWGDAPPSLPPGAQAAVLSGDPGKEGPFTLRLKAPAGYRIPKHWHPTDEHVTVLEGDATLSMDEGAQAHSENFGPGDYVVLPAHMHHAASTKGGMIVQVQAMGPFEINYIDPKDDPRGPPATADAPQEK